MVDPDKVTSVHRTAISIDVYDGEGSEALKELMERRRRILSTLSRHSRLRGQHATGWRPLRGPVVTWTVVAGNGRPIASSSELFANETAAERSAIATMARVDDIEVLRVRTPVAPAHAWVMRIDGVPRLIALRSFATARLRDRNAASVLSALESGLVVPPGEGRPHHRMPSARSPLGLTDDVRAELSEPLKVRGDDRPLRPILRSYVDQPVRTRIRSGGSAELHE
jgi:hypothetical protein